MSSRREELTSVTNLKNMQQSLRLDVQRRDGGAGGEAPGAERVSIDVEARGSGGDDRRLDAHLPEATRLIMVKADGCVAVHADGHRPGCQARVAAYGRPARPRTLPAGSVGDLRGATGPAD